MVDQLKELFQVLFEGKSIYINLAFATTIGLIAVYYGYTFFKKRKQTSNPNHSATVEEPQTQYYNEEEEIHDINGTLEVDKMIVHSLRYGYILDREYHSLQTTTGYSAMTVFDDISKVLMTSSDIYTELKREAKNGRASATVNGIESELNNGEVKIRTAYGYIVTSLNELNGLSLRDIEKDLERLNVLDYDAFMEY